MESNTAFQTLKAKTPVDIWTTREHLCLTSAVSQCGDQNWGAVSRAVRQLNVASTRPTDWFSTKHCALQYTKLMEGLDTPKRKRDKADDNQNDTPGVILHKSLVKKRIEELRSILEEQRAEYLKVKKDVELLEATPCEVDLNKMWDDIMKEHDDRDKEEEKEKEFYREREERLKKLLAVKLSLKGATFPSVKRKLSPLKSTTQTSVKKINDEPKDVSKNLEGETMKEGLKSTDLLLSPVHADAPEDSPSKQRKANEDLNSPNKRGGDSGSKDDDDEAKNFSGFLSMGEAPPRSEVKSLGGVCGGANKGSAETAIKIEATNDTSLDVTSVSTEIEEEEHPDPHGSSAADLAHANRSQSDHDYSHVKDTETVSQDEASEPDQSDEKGQQKLTLEVKRSNSMPPAPEEEDSVASKPGSPSAGDATSPTREYSPPPKSSPAALTLGGSVRDEYEFDDDASRDSATDVRDYLHRLDRRRVPPPFSDGIRSPAVSEGTPSSPASTNYGDDPEAEKLHRAWKKSVLLLWADVAAHKNASIFLKPISEDRVPGYRDIVYRPNDLMSLKRSVESGCVRTTLEFQRDLMLMFLNAKMFNTRSHLVYRMADQMMRDAVETVEEFIRSSQSSAKAVETPVKQLRRETRESSAKRGADEAKRKREEQPEKSKRRKT